ncbi:hypothetical protein EDC04DRAFT_177652 [Pisolithus marmoratus]|nr:hypothetical protein EDC04DRAFT_177652 [Pisolithus marmoratus]
MVSESSPLLSRSVPSPFLWRSGALLVTAGMVVGAFGAHALQRRPGITADNLLAWRTASNYAIMNGLGLLLISMHPKFSTHRLAGYAILGGGVVFSGSIMALVLWKKYALITVAGPCRSAYFSRMKFLGPITPLGGVIMMAGYAALAF